MKDLASPASLAQCPEHKGTRWAVALLLCTPRGGDRGARRVTARRHGQAVEEKEEKQKRGPNLQHSPGSPKRLSRSRVEGNATRKVTAAQLRP
ncbi:hypothetical protein AV530_003615 [Patagioenas fasciata monilis]|uniref:Uncharacterized protein n=1 Tax=Patagioenas fasciata monilis TaxID=372326 RepID=A0A1V4KYD7_PATFA|nr:hypothetical protein AV530_003615 [Patagioenas fasciata monilis]